MEIMVKKGIIIIKGIISTIHLGRDYGYIDAMIMGKGKGYGKGSGGKRPQCHSCGEHFRGQCPKTSGKLR